MVFNMVGNGVFDGVNGVFDGVNGVLCGFMGRFQT